MGDTLVHTAVWAHLPTAFELNFNMCSKFPCQIPNFEYAIDNVLIVCFSLDFVSILLLSCFDHKGKLKDG